MLLTLIYFILILGLIVLVHEFGHFFFSKLFGIYVYEFSIGMGPKLFGKKKGETEYSIRAIPIGGYCSLAGEDVDADDEAKIPKDRRLNAKPVWQRFLVMVFGAGNNFILALLILFIIGLGWGAVSNDAIVTQFAHYMVVEETNYHLGLKENDKILKIGDSIVDIDEHSELSYYIDNIKDKDTKLIIERKGKQEEINVSKDKLNTLNFSISIPSAEKAGVKLNDNIIKVNGHKVKSSEDVSLYIQIYGKGKEVELTVLRDNKELKINVLPDKEVVSNTDVYRIGVMSEGKVEHGFIKSIKYTFNRFEAILRQMIITLKGLFTGNLSVKQLSGPVGIYNVVGSQSKAGLHSVLYLIALLSINVGFINLLPFPAFDGGRVLFLIIEKIKGSPIKPQTENLIHTIGFGLLIALMLYVTFYDILRLL